MRSCFLTVHTVNLSWNRTKMIMTWCSFKLSYQGWFRLVALSFVVGTGCTPVPPPADLPCTSNAHCWNGYLCVKVESGLRDKRETRKCRPKGPGEGLATTPAPMTVTVSTSQPHSQTCTNNRACSKQQSCCQGVCISSSQTCLNR